MGSSAKRKKEKKQDFQKAKLKVGKTRPKPVNQTDTSFRAKAIVLNQQSLSVSAPSATHQFQHHVSMLSSRSDSQRKESLAYLTTYFGAKPVDVSLPQPVGSVLDKACPLILDASTSVRNQFLKFLQSIHPAELKDHVSKVLPFVRAGMTHLSRDIRLSTIEALSWLLDVAGDEVVSCPGGWVRTLDSFVTLLGWKLINDPSNWSSNKTAFGSDTKVITKVMQVLSVLMRIGFGVEQESEQLVSVRTVNAFPLWHASDHSIPSKSNAYFHLDLFGTQLAAENQILEDREDRIAIFDERFRTAVSTGVEAAKQEGGELGRAAGILIKALKLASDEK